MKWIVYCTDCQRELGSLTEEPGKAEVLAIGHWQQSGGHRVIVGYAVKPKHSTVIT